MVSEASPSITFDEAAGMIWQVRNDQEQLKRVVEAVRGLPLTITARIQRRKIFGGRDPAAYKDGYSYHAVLEDPPLRLLLYVRRDRVDEFERHGGFTWQGRGEIVDYSFQRNRLLVRVE